jgi:hypothetical protein
MTSPRIADSERWEVVGERCADAVVALCRIRAAFESAVIANLAGAPRKQ